LLAQRARVISSLKEANQMAADTLAQGRFLWHELLTRDLEDAQTFYPRVMGWEVQSFDESPTPYWVFNAHGQAVAGMMALPEPALAEGAPSSWLSYVYVQGLDEICAKAKSLGGKVVVPAQEIATVGRFAVILDPQGATIGVLDPADAPAPQPARSAPGHFRWAELATTDPESAFAYYSTLFGWRETDRTQMGEAGVYQMFGAGDGVTLGGIFRKPPEVPASTWLYYVNVPDLEDAVGTAGSLGGRILNGPMAVPGGERIAQCTDPQGAAFALHSYE
jgi:hypothetical protein